VVDPYESEELYDVLGDVSYVIYVEDVEDDRLDMLDMARVLIIDEAELKDVGER
jgi:hypothetical protein